MRLFDAIFALRSPYRYFSAPLLPNTRFRSQEDCGPFGDAQISDHLGDCASSAHQRDGIVLKLAVATPTAPVPVHGCLLLYHNPPPKIEETSPLRLA
jgi:hypothetical protein